MVGGVVSQTRGLTLEQTPRLRARIEAAAQDRSMSITHLCNLILSDYLSAADARSGAPHACCLCRDPRPTGEARCCWCDRWDAPRTRTKGSRWPASS